MDLPLVNRHGDDVLEAVLLVSSGACVSGQAHILCDGICYSARQADTAIYAILGRPVRARSLPSSLLRLVARVGDADQRVVGRHLAFNSDVLEKLSGSARCSVARICRDLGFKPQHDLFSSMPEIVASVAGR